MIIRPCEPADFDAIHEIINDAASAYRGIIAADRWHEPYMSREELRREMDSGVVFSGVMHEGRLSAVMGLQDVKDVALIRHAYTRTESRGKGQGSALLHHLRQLASRPMLVGTWRAASWAVEFYERRDFQLVSTQQKNALLREYWNVPERQIEESVVLADARWFDSPAATPTTPARSAR